MVYTKKDKMKSRKLICKDCKYFDPQKNLDWMNMKFGICKFYSKEVEIVVNEQGTCKYYKNYEKEK
jgi:hypothetical protein